MSPTDADPARPDGTLDSDLESAAVTTPDSLAQTKGRGVRWPGSVLAVPPLRPRAALTRRQVLTETWLVLLVSLGASAVWSTISLLRKALEARAAGTSLSTKTSTLNASRSSLEWLDAVSQLVGIALALVEATAEDLVAALVGGRHVLAAAREGAPATARAGARRGGGRCRVTLADVLADLDVGQLSHADSSSSASGTT